MSLELIAAPAAALRAAPADFYVPEFISQPQQAMLKDDREYPVGVAALDPEQSKCAPVVKDARGGAAYLIRSRKKAGSGAPDWEVVALIADSTGSMLFRGMTGSEAGGLLFSARNDLAMAGGDAAQARANAVLDLSLVDTRPWPLNARHAKLQAWADSVFSEESTRMFAPVAAGGLGLARGMFCDRWFDPGEREEGEIQWRARERGRAAMGSRTPLGRERPRAGGAW